MPGWMEPLVAAVGASMTAHGPDGPLGLRYRQIEDLWDLMLYALPVEMVGGAHDGGLACPSFSLDLERLRAIFTHVEEFGWDAHGTGPDHDEAGPCIAVRGEFAGRAVWLRILAYAPADIAPARKVDATGRKQAG